MEALTIANAQAVTSTTIGEAVYFQFLDFLDVSPKTRRTYTYNLKPFFQYLAREGVTRPTRETILAYRAELSETMKPATVHAYLAVVRCLFSWLEDAGLYPNVAKKVKSPKIEKGYKKDYLTAEQLREIVTPLERETEGGARDYAMVCLMACCGLRTVEVTRANIEDLKPLGGFTVLYVQGKGQDEKTEFVKVPNVVEKAIRAYLAKRGETNGKAPLFASASNNNKGGRLTTVAVSSVAKKAMTSAGFSSERLTAHSLRHSAITNALLAGNSLQDAQQLARHASITTTMIYNHAIDRLKNHCADDVASAIFA